MHSISLSFGKELGLNANLMGSMKKFSVMIIQRTVGVLTRMAMKLPVHEQMG